MTGGMLAGIKRVMKKSRNDALQETVPCEEQIHKKQKWLPEFEFTARR